MGKNVLMGTTVWTRIQGWSSCTRYRRTRQNFVLTTQTTFPSANTGTIVRLPTAKRKSEFSSFITMSLMKTSTCSTIKQNFAPSTLLNMTKLSASMPTISKTTAGTLQPTITDPSHASTGNSRTTSITTIRDAKMESIAVCAMAGRNYSIIPSFITLKSVFKLVAKRANAPTITLRSRKEWFRSLLKLAVSRSIREIESPTALSNRSRMNRHSFRSSSSQLRVWCIWGRTRIWVRTLQRKQSACRNTQLRSICRRRGSRWDTSWTSHRWIRKGRSAA